MIPIETLRILLSYDHLTGALHWRKRRAGTMHSNLLAGSIAHDGYLTIKVLGKTYRAHRLAWTLHYGVHPTKQIDHCNGIRSDNRIENLREATQSKNNANRRVSTSTRSNYKGVVPEKNGTFGARIIVNRKHIWLGVFETAELAHAAYIGAARVAFGDFARSS